MWRKMCFSKSNLAMEYTITWILDVHLVCDWNPAQSSVWTCYKVIETSFSSKLADKPRKQVS